MTEEIIFTAGPVNLVRTILIILAVYFALKLIGRYVMPWLARKAAHKMQQKMQDEMRRRSGQERSDRRREGEVTIEYTDQRKRKKNPSDPSKASRVGEYVDYEEVD